MTTNKILAEFLGILDLLNDPAAYEAYVKAEMARRRQNTARRNERFAAALSTATDIQAARIDALETSGMRVVKLWQNRATGRIAVMLQKEGVWDEIKMKMGTKLTMVYPDGRNQTAFGKVPVHNDWF